jgi:hypothetical protein
LSNQGEVDTPIPDPRSHRDREYDALMDMMRQSANTVDALSEIVRTAVEKAQNNNTVTYKVEGIGAVGVAIGLASVVVCIVIALYVGVENTNQNSRITREFERQDAASIKSEAKVDGRLRDLEAWRGVHATKIQNLESQLQKGQGK